MAAKIAGNLDISSLVILTLVQVYQLKSASSFALSLFLLHSAARQPTFLSEFFAAERSAPDRCSSHGIVFFAFPCTLRFHANWSCRGGEGGGNCENTINHRNVYCAFYTFSEYLLLA